MSKKNDNDCINKGICMEFIKNHGGHKIDRIDMYKYDINELKHDFIVRLFKYYSYNDKTYKFELKPEFEEEIKHKVKK